MSLYQTQHYCFKLGSFKYFKNNKEGIINQKENWNQGVCAESDVSHLVKSLKDYGAKIYNDKVLNNMLLINSAIIDFLRYISIKILIFKI